MLQALAKAAVVACLDIAALTRLLTTLIQMLGPLFEWIKLNAKLFSSVALVSFSFGLPTSASAGVCEYAKTSYNKVATGAAGASVVVGGLLKSAGVISVAHSSGAAIVATTSSGYVAGTIGAVGTAVGFITAPPVLIAGSIAAAGTGGTILYCHYANRSKILLPRADHPREKAQ